MIRNILNKVLSLYTLIKFKHVPKEYFYYIRDSYFCRINQLQYTLKDLVFKKKYKDISFSGEFAPELQFVLPFAYWHHKNGTLKETNSSKFTKELYFFSPNHREIFEERTPEGNYNFEIPRILYSQDYDIEKWEMVPLKQHYSNNIYVYDKPILIIANRYNMEWDGPPISFFDFDVLKFIIEKSKDKYTIIYNRPRPHHIIEDNSDIYDLNEYDWLKREFPDVLLMEDLYKENKGNASNYNHFQLLVYSNTNHFVSTHGGTAAFASYFGGINLILSKKGPEHYFKCYEKLYPKLSGAKIMHAKTNDEFKNYFTNNF